MSLHIFSHCPFVCPATRESCKRRCAVFHPGSSVGCDPLPKPAPRPSQSSGGRTLQASGGPRAPPKYQTVCCEGVGSGGAERELFRVPPSAGLFQTHSGRPQAPFLLHPWRCGGARVQHTSLLRKEADRHLQRLQAPLWCPVTAQVAPVWRALGSGPG